MKRLLPAFLSILAFSFSSHAAIVYQDFNPDKVLKLNDPALSFDLDGDAANDITFNFTGSTSNYNVTVTGPELEFAKGTGTHSSYPELLFIAKIVDAQKNWGNLGATETIASTSGRDLVGNKEFFIGIRFKSGSNYFYGWMLMELKSNFELHIKSVAFETIFNSYIIVGNTGSALIGQDEFDTTPTWTLYPTLVQDYLHIESEEILESVKVFSSNGAMVETENTESKMLELNLSSLKKGIYWIEAQNAKGIVFREKIVKQ